MSQKDPKPAETTQNYKTGKIYNFLLDIDFQIWNPNAQIWAFSAKKFWLSNLNEISHVPYFEYADFKFVICIWKFRA